jgi:hypothetical protein
LQYFIFVSFFGYPENEDIPTGQQIASVVGYLLEEKRKLECVLQQVK